MEKDKQPANLSSKQFVIGHHPDSRGILCFPLLPLHRAKTRETMKVAISLAEPSQTNTLDHSQQLCKGKHAQRLCSGIFLSQNWAAYYSLYKTNQQHNSLRQDTCQKMLRFSNMQDSVAAFKYYPRSEVAYFSISLLKEGTSNPFQLLPPSIFLPPILI